VSRVLDREFDHPLELEEQASIPLAGGIMQHGYHCGMIWGAALAAGARAYQLYGPGPRAETMAIVVAQHTVESFRTQNKHINCREITGLDLSSPALEMVVHFLVKGGVIRCFRMAAQYTPLAFREINTALSENYVQAPAPPVSCAALLAQKMGVSDLHTVMAAGFAGGVGLCGGACGALGAAIWILGMNILKEGAEPLGFKDPRGLDVIDRFVGITDHKFECSEIVGRKFKDVDDHAAYLREGGCSRIIEALTLSPGLDQSRARPPSS
jgi:hypothetical protein